MTEQNVIVTSRIAAPIDGFSTVTAQVDNGVSGDYTIATRFAGTQMEIDEILAQSATRKEDIDAIAPGAD